MSTAAKASRKTLPAAGLEGRLRLKPAEVARLAGCSIRTVWSAIAAGKLKAYRLGGDGNTGVLPADVQAWIEGRKP